MMNKEEIDKWLNEEYGCSYTRLEELHDFYFEKYCDLRDRISRAIEYIEKEGEHTDCSGEPIYYLDEEQEEELLEILEGKE